MIPFLPAKFSPLALAVSFCVPESDLVSLSCCASSDINLKDLGGFAFSYSSISSGVSVFTSPDFSLPSSRLVLFLSDLGFVTFSGFLASPELTVEFCPSPLTPLAFPVPSVALAVLSLA